MGAKGDKKKFTANTEKEKKKTNAKKSYLVDTGYFNELKSKEICFMLSDHLFYKI